MGELKSPVLLIGNVRSGTTVIQTCLSEHPGLVSWFEPRTVWMYADPGRRHDRFTDEDATPSVTRYIHRRFLHYQRRNGGRRIVEKTPSNVLRIPYVSGIFPESKVVYVIRNPLDQISSSELEWQSPISAGKLWARIKETPKSQLHYYLPRFVSDHVRKRLLKRKYISVWGVRYPGIGSDLKRLSMEEVLAKQWVESVRYAKEDLTRLSAERWIAVRYEDLVREPMEQFQRILDHLALDMTSSLAEKIKNSVRSNIKQKWARLEPEALYRSLSILDGPMQEEGYFPPSKSQIESINEARRSTAATEAAATSHGRKGV